MRLIKFHLSRHLHSNPFHQKKQQPLLNLSSCTVWDINRARLTTVEKKKKKKRTSRSFEHFSASFMLLNTLHVAGCLWNTTYCIHTQTSMFRWQRPAAMKLFVDSSHAQLRSVFYTWRSSHQWFLRQISEVCPKTWLLRNWNISDLSFSKCLLLTVMFEPYHTK